MINKIKNLVKENRMQQREQIGLLKELDWANVFHDATKNKKWFSELPLNIGRWAGGYPFFYILYRILNECELKSVLELGLGESTKLISEFIRNEKTQIKNHFVIEQDENWMKIFKTKFEVSDKTNIMFLPIKKESFDGYEINCYSNLTENLPQKFDFYLVDGPIKSERFSRFDIVKLAENLTEKDQFVILIDDYQRIGEKDTVKKLIEKLESKNIKTYSSTYSGIKSTMLICTEQYKFLSSL